MAPKYYLIDSFKTSRIDLFSEGLFFRAMAVLAWKDCWNLWFLWYSIGFSLLYVFVQGPTDVYVTNMHLLKHEWLSLIDEFGFDQEVTETHCGCLSDWYMLRLLLAFGQGMIGQSSVSTLHSTNSSKSLFAAFLFVFAILFGIDSKHSLFSFCVLLVFVHARCHH